MCHVCVYYGVIIKKWTIFNKGEMAFLKFFCLFKQLKTRTALCIQCRERLGCIFSPARFNFANSQKTETNAFSASEGERASGRERRGHVMGLGDEANGRRRYTSQLSIPRLCSLQLTAALHALITSGAGLHVLHNPMGTKSGNNWQLWHGTVCDERVNVCQNFMYRRVFCAI